VRTGLDVLQSQGFASLKGKRVGLIINHTAVNQRGEPLADLLRRAEGVHLAAIFSPEHGFTGRIEHGQRVENDSYQGIRIYSLYGDTKRPAPETLKDLDALVFDIQDVGARFYTYITTLAYALEEAAKAGLEFYVLDRPNPAGGHVVEGAVLDSEIRHFTAYFSVPARHGMTVGELARWHNDKAGLNARLMVVPVQGWSRNVWWEKTGLPFLPPSPNIRTPKTALLYGGIGIFESTNVAVGRGTPTPFELFGAPWMDGKEVARRLNALRLPGVRFKAARFTPQRDRYAGEPCSGVRVIVTDRDLIRPVDIFMHAACLLRELSPAEFQPRWEEMPRMVGSREFERLYKSGASAEEILKWTHQSAESFLKQREPFLLYP
jgi:uncharacterized protein YbbC (DUF1343 family)